ncbi:MAG TPA: glycosyltransferase [Spirochaetia bacterium]|nr:glycosyltransferase [Spirochaetia bacterium]
MGDRISLCMIARNEEENLGRCLDSAAGCVDEIVLVDTGSADATVEVAKSYGARVRQSPWHDDFSMARNQSLAEAAGDWILVLDADEELPPEAVRFLREQAGQEDTDAWTFTVVSNVSTGEDLCATRHAALRMFRNRPEHRFEGLVHEQVRPSILRNNPTAGIRHANLEIRHHGYVVDGGEAGNKTGYKIRLLQKALAAKPFDAFQNYNLGVSYLTAREPEKARSHFEIAHLATDARSGFAPALYRNYALCLYELGEFTDCLKLLDEGLGHFPAYPDLHFLKGRLFFELGLLAQARACLQACTGFRHVPPEYPTMEGITSYLSEENLAGVALKGDDPDMALEHLGAAYSMRRSYSVALRLALVLKQKGLSRAGLRQALTGRFDLDDPAMARLFYDLGEYEACLEHLAGSDGQPAFSLLRARCLTRLGQPDAALKLLDQLSGTGVDPAEAEREVWLAGWLRGAEQAAPTEEAADEENAALIEEVAYAAWIRGEHERALSLAAAVAGEKARLRLAGYALGHNQPVVVETLLAEEAPGAAGSYLKGQACAERGRHREAFLHYVEAAGDRGKEKMCYLRALEEVIIQCQLMVLQLLNVEGPNGVLQLELFRLASRQKKLGRYKGESTVDAW